MKRHEPVTLKDLGLLGHLVLIGGLCMIVGGVFAVSDWTDEHVRPLFKKKTHPPTSPT